MAEVRSYRDLEVWQIGVAVCLDVYRVTARFPPDERYGLTSQLRRCAVSIPSNLAEGHTRDSTGDYLRHVGIARGSLAELETQLVIAEQLSYLPATQIDSLRQRTNQLSRMLAGLRAALARRRKQ